MTCATTTTLPATSAPEPLPAMLSLLSRSLPMPSPSAPTQSLRSCSDNTENPTPLLVQARSFRRATRLFAQLAHRDETQVPCKNIQSEAISMASARPKGGTKRKRKRTKKPSVRGSRTSRSVWKISTRHRQWASSGRRRKQESSHLSPHHPPPSHLASSDCRSSAAALGSLEKPSRRTLEIHKARRPGEAAAGVVKVHRQKSPNEMQRTTVLTRKDRAMARVVPTQKSSKTPVGAVRPLHDPLRLPAQLAAEVVLVQTELPADAQVES